MYQWWVRPVGARARKARNLADSVKPRYFWNKLLLNGILLNKRVGWNNFLIFLLNITSCACLLKSGLKIIFHWKAQLVIAFRSWLKVVALVWMLFTTEKRDFFIFYLPSILYFSRIIRWTVPLNISLMFRNTRTQPFRDVLKTLVKLKKDFNFLPENFNFNFLYVSKCYGFTYPRYIS